MTWKPTQGILRAEPIAAEFTEELALAGLRMEPVYQWRLCGLIAKAIDQALADGAEQDALNAVVANGAAHSADIGVKSAGFGPGQWPGPGGVDQVLMKDGWRDVPATADPVGIEPVERIPEDDLARSLAIQAAERGAVEAFGRAKKSTRGRPKGSTNKAKKKAKAAKAKVEAVAEPVAADSAEEAAS